MQQKIEIVDGFLVPDQSRNTPTSLSNLRLCLNSRPELNGSFCRFSCGV
jgi:hypothetical protein